MKELQDLDLLSQEQVDNPYPTYKLLRENDPVHWSERLQGWLLTRTDDITFLLKDPRFSANRTHLFAKQQLRGLDPDIMKDYLRLTASMIVMKDGADHARLREQEDRTLCPAHVEQWSPSVHRIVGELLDRVQKQRQMELVADMSEPLPSLLLTELYGIPAEDRLAFQRWADDATAFFAVTPHNVEAVARRANAGMVELERYITKLIEERREQPGRDLVSAFIEAERSGKITTHELVANCVHMLIVGHVTSIAMLSNGVYELLRHPEALEQLRRRPELIESAVEETVRFSPAVHFTHRIALEDIELRGKTIRKGQIAFFGLASAARDPELFPNPDRFDITRPMGRHIAFGSGPHNCAGTHLGRRELAVGFQLLFKRMPELRLDENDPPRRRANGLTFRGFARLPLRF